jgi:hypothetical protein
MQLKERGVHFRSVQEQMDTSMSGGKLAAYTGVAARRCDTWAIHI